MKYKQKHNLPKYIAGIITVIFAIIGIDSFYSDAKSLAFFAYLITFIGIGITGICAEILDPKIAEENKRREATAIAEEEAEINRLTKKMWDDSVADSQEEDRKAGKPVRPASDYSANFLAGDDYESPAKPEDKELLDINF